MNVRREIYLFLPKMGFVEIKIKRKDDGLVIYLGGNGLVIFFRI